MSSSLANPRRILVDRALDQLADYGICFPDERPALRRLDELLRQPGDDPFSRANMAGHVTTSGLVYDRRSDSVLLVHHRSLDRWLQPGGHHEGTDNLRDSAAREVVEETGIQVVTDRLLFNLSGPIDIDSHDIPANASKGEATHVHHDFLYLFDGDSTAPLSPQWTEVRGAKWVSRAALSEMGADRLRRVADKLSRVLLAS